MENKSGATATPKSKPTKLALSKKPPADLALQKKAPPELYDDDEEDPGSMSEPTRTIAKGARRMVPVHQSRIRDRPAKPAEKDSSLKIKIELDLEVEVEIYARVKGDVTIGLM
jgi:hypothetical protein